jgi:hypothetical protein
VKSTSRGKNTSQVEIAHISTHGIWILAGERELFMPFKEFPWFHQASVRSVMNVEIAGPEHLYWPELDIDLSIESIQHPEQFPLVSRVRVNGKRRTTAAGTRRKKVARKPKVRSIGSRP